MKLRLETFARRGTCYCASPTATTPIQVVYGTRSARAARAHLHVSNKGLYFKEWEQPRECNHVGLYALQVHVEFLTGPQAGIKRWVDLSDFDKLWKQP